MTQPTTPLTDEVREWIAFALWFKTRAGFMIVYSNTLASIWHSQRDKRGLKTKAYEATEVYYQEIVREGRKYPDIENFFRQHSHHCKAPGLKVRDTSE